MSDFPRRSAVRHVAGFLTLLLFALQLACATGSASAWKVDGSSSHELYRRPTPPRPRIPGEVAHERRYASSESPMRLTASDGTGLVLRRLEISGVIDDPISRTELQLTFENPHDRTLDGEFELLLPPGAEVSRFAMQVGGTWVESEIVEREQATQVYQAHKHTRRDPALLERERGRRFRGRVFPIAPRERKQIIVSYTNIHEQVGGVFRVPLAGLARIDSFELRVVRRRPGTDDEVLERHADHEPLLEDFVVALDGPDAIGRASANQALLRLVPVPARAPAQDDLPKHLSVLVDTSASMAAAAQASEEAVAGLLAALEQAGLGQIPIEIIAFDQTREPLHRGTVAGAREAVVPRLRERARLGASDLVAALDAVDPASDRVIVIGDGEVSAGGDGRYELSAALERAGDRGVVRLDAIALGSGADVELLEWLVADGRLRAGVVLDPVRSEPATWIPDLLAPPLGRIDVAVVGAKQVWPTSFTGLRPGQSVVVEASFARNAPGKATVQLSGAQSGSVTLELRPGDDALIGRAIAQLRVKALIAELETGSGSTATIEHEIVELSKRYGILSDQVAMLVLESDRAYAEFGIARTISADELNMAPSGRTRDFTAVVDMAPTASRDSAGISLAGTTGAETRYSVDGAGVDYDVDGSYPRKRRWRAEVRGHRLGERDRAVPKPARALERELDEVMSRCARHDTATSGYLEEYALTLALRFDASGSLVEVRSNVDPGGELLDCVRYRLLELAGPAIDERPDAAPPAFELLHRYEFRVMRGWGEPPDDWRIPEVSDFVRERGYAGQSGTAGWAKFIEEGIAAGLLDEALDVAWTWHRARPSELLPYVSLGDALAAAGQPEEAARAYGSLIDIHPARAETHRFAGALLESLDDPVALELAIDSYRKARTLRPDHPGGYQALALALARRGDYQDAVDTLVDALGRTYSDGRFGDAVLLMRRDLATLAAAAILAHPESRGDVLTQLVDTMIVPEAVARDWLTLSWESDASNLSLRIVDAEGEEYLHGRAPMSREVSNGFGPQGFEWTDEIDGPIHVSVLVGDLGPEGVALGCLRRVRFDGRGQLEFDTRPFVIWPGQGRVGFGEL